MSRPRVKALVLGAGISGLAAARALEERGFRTCLLESCPEVGGLTRTANVGDFCFDYTGHFLHLVRYSSPGAIPYANLHDDDWQRVERKSYCYVGGKLITAPIQYHLGELPADMLKPCIESYDSRPRGDDSRRASFREYIISGFGQYLADIFLIPQNEKTMAISLDRLSTQAVKRFFPPPNESRVRAGFEGSPNSQPEYNSQFWYPKTGGIQRLVHGFARNLQSVFTLEEAVELNLRRKKIRTKKGHEWDWELLFSSIPLRTLCTISDDSQLRAWAKDLTHSSTVTINLGVRGALPSELRNVHWIYVPDRSIPFYRVGFYSNISKEMCPADSSCVYVEVGLASEDLEKAHLVGDLQPKVLQALANLGWLDVKSICCSVMHVMGCAYIHHTPGREGAVENILSRLESFDVFSIGRYGLWDYTSMEDSIYSAISAVEKIG